ncbi:oxaloacetate decarboxylase subunit alpha [Leptotrichia massiliensis]|uniref:oxaloacetate decarboxylase subunit alpha n=1 Tax=Leptotrichia massiliensis TaxID=1852388 RepID=UPI0028EF81FB|nr:oxaloacetate decarboxylase subunit alpha [Leptotrichia massiliensis]
MGKVKITETSLRDGHQSLMATRMTTAEMLPIIETMDKIGYHAMEVWGGATYDAAIRFLHEDPWERLREIRKRAKNTKLQMLLRGQNVLGYRHYADDIVDRFVELSIKNGIDIIRTFDALNDTRNIRKASESTKKYGGHSQLAICYTISPVHTIEYYKKLALEMQSMGADSIAIKDMSGILLPNVASILVTELKSVLNIPLELHTHSTAGLAEMSIIEAIDAGVDIVDTAISPFGGGTSQPCTEPLVRTLQGTEYDTELNLELLKEVAEYFKPIRKKYIDNGTLNPKALGVEPNIVEYQLPGGMLSNLLSQLKSQGAEDKYEDVLREIPKVRKDLGYPPLVTPMSQMVGTQSVMNILTGKKYYMIPKEIKDYVKGMYGKSPVPIDENIKKTIVGDEEVFTGRPADLLKDEYDTMKSEIGDLAKSDEDVLTYACFPQIAKGYLKEKYSEKKDKETRIDNKEEVKIQNINVIF